LGRIEGSIVESSRQLARARQHARLAMDLALGALQVAAGPDQRVSATAAGLSVTNSHYTGIWATATAGPTAVTWLVSGNEGLNPLAVSPGDSIADPVELVGLHTSGVG